MKAQKGLESQDCVWSWQTHCICWFVSWIWSLGLSESLHPRRNQWSRNGAILQGFPEWGWCSFSTVPFLPLELISTQHSLSHPCGPTRIMPTWHQPLEMSRVSSLAWGCCRSRTSAGGFCCWAAGSALSPRARAGDEAAPSAPFEAAQILPHKMPFIWQAQCPPTRAYSVWCLL